MDECATDPCQYDCPDNDGTLSSCDLLSSQNMIDSRSNFNWLADFPFSGVRANMECEDSLSFWFLASMRLFFTRLWMHRAMQAPRKKEPRMLKVMMAAMVPRWFHSFNSADSVVVGVVVEVVVVVVAVVVVVEAAVDADEDDVAVVLEVLEVLDVVVDVVVAAAVDVVNDEEVVEVLEVVVDSEVVVTSELLVVVTDSVAVVDATASAIVVVSRFSIQSPNRLSSFERWVPSEFESSEGVIFVAVDKV
ncbi:hypothetical protein CNMCM5623_003857 [Aspergillus felis]|uniref:Uncharacterized protein n=1 Tax=Aspergillus felis TaxID=1287682 RepID=A0A8H6PPZ2_9EURO|nr:hypothetical protein CNMCM5623_003857 [Aspergillus felis]KAF7179387.1 hypothetical protein CNMCM7691_008320 [Aspergillus felis]